MPTFTIQREYEPDPQRQLDALSILLRRATGRPQPAGLRLLGLSCLPVDDEAEKSIQKAEGTREHDFSTTN